ncbi:universal stress protein [Mucilaginibacter sp. UR6-11]|uniref:universal stress protein n=1 Tax=Mucilaginibacter sp. UR6-11 TaxID=1435644 RepID=UPI001E38EC09|nr:universal stress protein [Mucilaginibacter sp. UR6-11]MCC8423401.1 universal stress protein [Mucilaginibacter sp. UR6-11]
MKTYLVPIDFSQASINAAEFAAALSKQTNVENIILLNAYYVSPIETMLPSPDMVQLLEGEVEQNAADRIKNLEQLKLRLSKVVRAGVTVSIHLNRSHLLRAVIENVAVKNADLVILGSKGNTSKHDSQIGGHVVKISKASPVPVIVVPPGYSFETIKRVVVACDFDKVKETVPLESLKKMLDKKKFELLIVNIDKDSRHLSGDAERRAEETALHQMLKPYHPKYSYVHNTDVINGILQFATDNDAQLVIALPHKYSFFQSLLHDSVSQQLAASAAVPVLLLK